MSALALSNLVLWVAVAVLALLVVALMRQIGVLNERVFPAGALLTASGPTIGTALPATTAPTLADSTVTVGGAQPQDTLLLFVAPGCPICKTLLPYVRSVIRGESPATRLLLASDADGEPELAEHREFLREHALPPGDYLLSRALGLSLGVDKLPYAVLLDRQGVLRARGMVNSREHLESLFEASALGVASLQDYLAASRHSP